MQGRSQQQRQRIETKEGKIETFRPEQASERDAEQRPGEEERQENSP